MKGELTLNTESNRMTKSVNVGGVLLAVAASTFLATFNETFLNVALNPIMASMAVSAGTVQWLTTAYMLAAAIMVPVTGFLYQKVPTRRLFLVALGLLLAGTLMGAAAPAFGVLVAARVVQALGTGMIVPIGMNLVLAISAPEKLGANMGIVTAMTTLGPAFGPIAAGAVLAAFDWPALFVAFAVLVVACIAVAAVFVGNVAELTNPRMDAPSVCLVSLGLVGLLYGLSTVFSGQLAVAGAALAVGIACMAAFIVRQRRLDHPFLDLRPFGVRSFRLGAGVVLAALMTVFSMNIVLPLFMQGSLGFTPLQAALTLLPACLVSCVLAPIAGKAYDRWGISVIVPVGMGVITCFVLALSFCDSAATSLLIVALYAPAIAGCAFTMGPAQSHALASLDRSLYPHGVTIMSTLFQIAGCVGSSLFVGVLSMVQASAMANGAAEAAAVASGFDVACLVAFAVDVCGFVLALMAARAARRSRTAAAQQVVVKRANALQDC